MILVSCLSKAELIDFTICLFGEGVKDLKELLEQSQTLSSSWHVIIGAWKLTVERITNAESPIPYDDFAAIWWTSHQPASFEQ
jgi:hypothetical protein